MDCTEQAQQLWSIVMPDHPWPKGWTCKLRKMRSCYGRCAYGRKVITLNWNADYPAWHGGLLVTLIHEMVHMHYGWELKHGREFRRIQGRWMRRFYGFWKPVPHLGDWFDPFTGARLNVPKDTPPVWYEEVNAEGPTVMVEDPNDTNR